MTPQGRGESLRHVEGTRYRIVVKGRLSAAFAAGFDDLELEGLPGATALEGSVASEAELDGILERLRNLGIELVSVDAGG